MQKTLLIMFAEMRTTLRRKSFVIFAFGIPLVLGLVALGLGVVNRNALTETIEEVQSKQATAAVNNQVGYVDEGGIIQTLPADMPADWLTRYADKAAAQAALDAGIIAGYYVIAPDYVQSGDVTYVTTEFSVLTDQVDTSRIDWILLVNVLGGDAQLATNVQQPLEVFATSLAPPAPAAAAEESWITEMFPLFMVLILYMAMIMPGSILINALIDEKKNRVMEVLMTSVSPTQMVTGKIMALGVLGLVMVAMWLGVLWGVGSFGGQALSIPAGFSVPTALLVWALIYFLGGYAIYGAQFAGVGALAPDVNQTKSVTWIVMMPIVIGYVLMTFTFDNPNGPLAVFLSLFPLTSPVAMIGRMAGADVPLWQAVLAAVLQFVTAYFIIRLTARLFRAQNLLAGQAFSPKTYYRTLLGRA